MEEDITPVEKPTEQMDLTDIFDFGQDETPVSEMEEEEESTPIVEEDPEPTVEIIQVEPEFVPDIYIEPELLISLEYRTIAEKPSRIYRRNGLGLRFLNGNGSSRSKFK